MKTIENMNNIINRIESVYMDNTLKLTTEEDTIFSTAHGFF